MSDCAEMTQQVAQRSFGIAVPTAKYARLESNQQPAD
jgi:hypothetical protein